MNYLNRLYSRVFRKRSVARMCAVVVAVSLCSAVVSALDVSHYTSSSVLSQGRWVRVRVSGSGMKLLTAAKLKSMGFKDVAKVNVYGYGGNLISEALDARQPDDLPVQPVVRMSDGSILFYGTGTVAEHVSASGVQSHTQNHYSTESWYYLSDRDVPEGVMPDAQTTPADGEAAEVVTMAPAMVWHERELEAAGPTGRQLLGEDFRSQTTQSFTLGMPGRVAGTPYDITVQMAAKSAMGSNEYSFSLGGNELPVGQLVIDGLRGSYSDTHSRIGIWSEKIADATDHESLDLSIAYRPVGVQVVYMSRLDYVRVEYMRDLRLDGVGEIQFAFAAPSATSAQLRISGCDATTQVWDVTDPATPVRIETGAAGSDGVLTFNALAGAHRYVAFTPSKVTTEITAQEKVANQDLHAMATPDMLIITPDAFASQARRIAELHSIHDGMDVAVLTPQEIYNEFSSGAPDVSAFRKLLKMWYDRDPDKIRYCLLFGRATYDNRMITSTVKSSGYPRLPIWESLNSSTETGSYCTDNFIGMLDDCDIFEMGKARVRVAVGRMPVKSASEAGMAVDKLIGYVENPQPGAWRNQVMVIADDADYGDHLRQAQKVVAAMQNNGNGADFIYERLYLDSYPLGSGSTSKSYPEARKRMFKIWDDGVGFVDFIGHGNPTSLTHENLLTYSDVTSMTNRCLPIMLAATCEFMRFDSNSISAAELMWLNPNGGTIAFIAANRKVYISNNGELNEAIAQNLYRRAADGGARRLGDVYVAGLNDYPASDDNRHRYALMGDPAMRVVSPEYHVTVDELDGTALEGIADASDYPVVKARSKVKVKGRVVDGSGTLLADFNGRIVPTLFDAERVIETYGHSSVGEDDGKVMIYNDRKNRLFTGSFPVSGGEWEATLIIPEEIDDNYSPALLNLYAYCDDNREANGSTEQFYIYGFADEGDNPDETEPEILGIGLNSYMFRDGSVVNSTPLFVARVRDENGINISSSGMGKQMTLIIDGRRIYEDLVDHYTPDPDDYLAGEVQYSVPALDDGDHTLSFTVWDNAGNCATRTLDFKVKADMQPSVNVYTDASPATSSVTFYITPDLPANGLHCHVAVYDLSGRMVWDAEATDSGNPAMPMQARWDLTDRNGARVDRGIYIYRCTVKSPEGKETVVAKKLAVTAG